MPDGSGKPVVKARFGHLHRLPQDYAGERHVMVTKHLPSRSGQEWVEFEEAPGPDPSPVEEAGRPHYIDVVFVGKADQTQ